MWRKKAGTEKKCESSSFFLLSLSESLTIFVSQTGPGIFRVGVAMLFSQRQTKQGRDIW